MKVYLHIATESEFMDAEVQVAVECSAAPRIGDSFNLTEPDTEALENAVIKGGVWKVRQYDAWIFGMPGKYSLSFEDCLFVSDALWRANEAGEYEYHICLNATNDNSSDPPERYMEKTVNFKDSDYTQVIESYEQN